MAYKCVFSALFSFAPNIYIYNRLKEGKKEAIGLIDKPVLGTLFSPFLLSAGGGYRESGKGTVQIILLKKKALGKIRT